VKKALAIWKQFLYNVKAFRMEPDFAPGDAGKTRWARGRKAPEEITNFEKEKKPCLSYP
jgi:hypothetical protein